MIRKLARLLLLLAIALAVPSQGAAAVIAGFCMAAGHHEPSASGARDHAHHGDEAPATKHSHAAGGQEGTHCAPCVSCCGAASICAVSNVVPQASPASQVDARPGAAAPDFLPGRLDRPPLAL